MLTIIGLGVREGDLTLRGAEKIKNADKVYVKTAETPTYKFFEENGIETESFDGLFDSAADFDALNEAIYLKLSSEKSQNTVFCVNGNGADDVTVKYISGKIPFEIIYGAGHFDGALALSPDTSASEYSALDVVNSKAFYPDKRRTVIIREIDGKLLMQELKLILADRYGDDKQLFLQNGKQTLEIYLSELDRQPSAFYDYSTICVLPAESFLDAKRHDFTDILEIMEGLLGENGCPWDRAQTHASIRGNMIEEAYELVDAIDKNDVDNMQEETGDVLLQSVFHAALGKKGGEYNQSDVMTGLCIKLIGRHTHIFGDVKASNADEALTSWDKAKNKEKSFTTLSEKLESIPKNLPALLYAYKVQKVAVKCGFDWDSIDGTYDKLFEEIAELRAASASETVEEAGDVLFSAVNPLRWLKIEPELALRAACEKFIKRFTYMETEILKAKKDLADAATREEYWQLAKEALKEK